MQVEIRLHSSDGAAGIYVPEQGNLFRHGINFSFTLQIEVAESVLGELVKQVWCYFLTLLSSVNFGVLWLELGRGILEVT